MKKSIFHLSLSSLPIYFHVGSSQLCDGFASSKDSQSTAQSVSNFQHSSTLSQGGGNRFETLETIFNYLMHFRLARWH